jgi:hypothetical protein
VSRRFTIDGSNELEYRLSALCDTISAAVQGIVPASKLQALVLAGGYGRAEGGVLQTAAGDRPYNDIEFYVFICGNPLLNSRRYRRELDHLGHELSGPAGLHVEFKIESIDKLRRGSVSMFSYDLVSAHRIVCGSHGIFAGCQHHLEAGKIPVAEATRLLLNRCTGLLLARECLDDGNLDPETSDFVGRNLAKAKLAFGDALLAARHRYHWSCRERHQRLIQLQSCADAPDGLGTLFIDRITGYHSEGVEFKLHPRRLTRSATEFRAEDEALSAVAAELWLWLESRRLNRSFASLREYALAARPGDPESFSLRNYALNARAFGLGALFDPLSRFYPRERLLSSLPLLLHQPDVTDKPLLRAHLRKQLRTQASDWSEFVHAYKQLWSNYA